MTLHEFLKSCNKDDYVGIWDVDYPVTTESERRKHKRPFEGRPNQQQYFKIGNIPYGKVMYFLDKEILCINHTEKGFLVKIHTKGKASKSLDMMEQARYIAEEIARKKIMI